MKITYDVQVDVLRILLSEVAVTESSEEQAGIIMDYDQKGNVIGFEILNASKRVDNPRNVNLAVNE